MAILIGETSRVGKQDKRKFVRRVSGEEGSDTRKDKYRCKECGAILVRCDADLPHVFIHEGKLYAKAIPNYVVDTVDSKDIRFVGYTCANCGSTIMF